MVRYALTEGFGIVYERIIREWFFERLHRQLNIGSVLEVPADGSSGFPAINSTSFAKEGCQVAVVNSDIEALKKSRALWKAMGLRAHHLRASEYLGLPLRSDVFDLVWNYCEIEKSKYPRKLLKEMTRVSRNYVLPMMQNSYTYGYYLHLIHHRRVNRPWDHGNPKMMRIDRIVQIVEECELEIVETGLIDAPPFPDTWEIISLPISKKKDMESGIREFQIERPVPLSVKFIYFIESVLPELLKLIFAHHPYVLASKFKLGKTRRAQRL